MLGVIVMLPLSKGSEGSSTVTMKSSLLVTPPSAYVIVTEGVPGVLSAVPFAGLEM